MIDARRRRPLHAPLALALLGLASPSCHRGGEAPSADPSPPASPYAFTDVTERSGVRFVHENGARGRRQLPETMGGGAAWLDVEGDGDLDLFLVQSGPLEGGDGAAENGLFLNRGDATFEDGTARSGAAARTGYGQGVAAGDVDGDGRTDLYVTCFGRNVLLANRGDGGFADRTTEMGLEDDRWGTSAAFFDAENDGDLDLYLVNYLRYDLQDVRRLADDGEAYLAYPHPDKFRSAPDVLFRNDGSGRFQDVTAEAGIRDVDGKGLGVVPADLDDDGDLDLYVANDSTPNFVFENLGGGTFADRTVASDAGYNADGRTEAGMGVAVGDVDGDLAQDVFVTNLDGESNTLYRNLGGLRFADETRARGLALPSMSFVGFGTAFLDVEFDGDLDLLVANGHIIDNVEALSQGSGARYRQRAQLFVNDGEGRFGEVVGAALPPALAEPRVARALALADYDEDGDLDAVLVQNGGPAVLLRNDARREGRFLGVRPVDSSGHDVLHATVRAETAAGEVIVRASLPGASYCSSHDPRILLGVKEARLARVVVRWPTGERVVLEDVETDRTLTVRPDGTVESRTP